MIPTPKVVKVEPSCDRHGPMTASMRLSGDGPVACTECIRISGPYARAKTTRPSDVAGDDSREAGWR